MRERLVPFNFDFRSNKLVVNFVDFLKITVPDQIALNDDHSTRKPGSNEQTRRFKAIDLAASEHGDCAQ